MILDVLLLIVISVIAVAMVVGKGIKVSIKIEHKYPQVSSVDTVSSQQELDENAPKSMDGIVAAINEIMEVNMYDE